MADALVSILIRTTGRQAALTDAMESLRRQVFRNFEIIVVEDGPATLSMFFTSYYKDLSPHYEALGIRKGRSAAANRAMALAKGTYFIFLDDDDLFTPAHLEKLVEKAMGGSHPIVYSWAEERKVERQGNGRITKTSRIRRWRREKASLLQMINRNFLPINAVLFHRSLYEKTGGFDTDLEYLEDWMFWLRCIAIEPEWHFASGARAIYHVPYDNAQRKRTLHSFRGRIYEKMHTIQPGWSLYTLRNDLRNHFWPALILRRIYFCLTSFLPYPR